MDDVDGGGDQHILIISSYEVRLEAGRVTAIINIKSTIEIR